MAQPGFSRDPGTLLLKDDFLEPLIIYFFWSLLPLKSTLHLTFGTMCVHSCQTCKQLWWQGEETPSYIAAVSAQTLALFTKAIWTLHHWLTETIQNGIIYSLQMYKFYYGNVQLEHHAVDYSNMHEAITLVWLSVF